MRKLLISLMIICIAVTVIGCSPNANNPNASEGSGKATDSWRLSTPEEQGMDASILANANKRISVNYPNIYSFLVVRHGYLVYEKYYQGMNAASANPVYSVTKSVMSALTGIAQNENLLEDVDQYVMNYLPEYFSEVDDAKKKEITIKQVLTMMGGLESIDSNYWGYFSSADWIEYTLQKPLVDDPGEKWAYNTGLTHLLSAVITETSKMSTFDFAEKHLFKPLGMDVETWEMDNEVYYGGGTGLFMTPRDMAKFGYLYLNNGKWDGNQVIPEDWVIESTRKHVSVEPGVDYGYLFWCYDEKAKVNDKAYSAYGADGAGGQYIMVVPDLDLVVVITANKNSRSLDNADTSQIIWDFAIPAVKE